MKKTVICYKTVNPIYYNKGTKYETTENTFLAYYTYKTIEEAQEEVNTLNATHPERLWTGERLDWAEIDYFFVSEQEEMY